MWKITFLWHYLQNFQNHEDSHHNITHHLYAHLHTLSKKKNKTILNDIIIHENKRAPKNKKFLETAEISSRWAEVSKIWPGKTS